MEQENLLDWLLNYLCAEYAVYTPIPNETAQKRALLRRLVNIRPPRPVADEFINIQDAFLQEEAQQRGIVRLNDISPCESDSRLSIWQGDITRLEVDAIVNAANSKLLGCFVPGHHCIDNAIHTFAGVQLRQACYDLMEKQGHDEPTGAAKITPAYNLPCRYVLHTVGPINTVRLRQKDCDLLASCYRSCLELAVQYQIGSVAFCCISTGEFRFPKEAAAEIAVRTVMEFLTRDKSIMLKRVVFTAFTDIDYRIYDRALSRTV